MSSTDTFVKRLLDSYALPSRDGRIFASTVAVYSAGNGLYLTGGTIFFVQGIGLSAAQVGTGLSIAGLVGFLTTVPVSALANRFGALGTLRLLHLWRMVWFAALAFAGDIVTFTVCASLLTMGQGPTTPMTQMVVSTIAGEADRTRTFAVIRTVSNVGMSLGALAAAPFLAVQSTWAFRTLLLANAAAFLVAAVLLGRLKVSTGAPEAKRSPWQSGALAAIRRDRPYAALTVANGVLYLHTVLLAVGLPLWIVQSTEAPAGLLSVLIVLNTVLAIALQVHFAKSVKDSRDGVRALRNAGWALAAFCPVLLLASETGSHLAIALLVLATVLLTGGELWQAAGGWELSYTHAPESSRAEYLSVFSLGGSAAGIAGPALLALLMSRGTWGLLVLAVLFLAASTAITVIGPRLARRAEDIPS